MTVLSRSKKVASTVHPWYPAPPGRPAQLGSRTRKVTASDGARRGGAGMDVCLMIEGQEGVSWDQWVALALACEEHGFDAMFRSDHYVSFSHPAEYGSLDAWTTLAALGVRTERIRLGTLVSPVTFRHPSVLAKSVVTADHASGGRVELGIGAGWFEGEHSAFGFPFPPTGARDAIPARSAFR